jgi:hypothetical protein
MMSLHALTRIVEPPAKPLDVPRPEDWAAVEAKIGTALPSDYKHFVQTFGLGKLSDFIWIYNPFTRYKYVNLVAQISMQRDVLREVKKQPGAVPFNIFPEIGGLLPLGGTDNGNTLFWLTRGSPEHWRIAINEARGPEWNTFKLDLTSLLAALLSRKIRCTVFPDDFPAPQPSFCVPAFQPGKEPPTI